jgi:hypothetical protein
MEWIIIEIGRRWEACVDACKTFFVGTRYVLDRGKIIESSVLSGLYEVPDGARVAADISVWKPDAKMHRSNLPSGMYWSCIEPIGADQVCGGGLLTNECEAMLWLSHLVVLLGPEP